EGGQPARGGRAGAGAEVDEEGGAGGGPVRAPELAAMDRLLHREVGAGAEHGRGAVDRWDVGDRPPEVRDLEGRLGGERGETPGESKNQRRDRAARHPFEPPLPRTPSPEPRRSYGLKDSIVPEQGLQQPPLRSDGTAGFVSRRRPFYPRKKCWKGMCAR